MNSRLKVNEVTILLRDGVPIYNKYSANAVWHHCFARRREHEARG